jgi:hypothetical protein
MRFVQLSSSYIVNVLGLKFNEKENRKKFRSISVCSMKYIVILVVLYLIAISWFKALFSTIYGYVPFIDAWSLYNSEHLT